MTKKIAQLHYLTQDLDSISHVELVKKACEGGVKWVQLRVKNAEEEEWFQIAAEAQSICTRFGAQLIINDNPKIALRIGADGVHLGKSDMDVSEARSILGTEKIIGGTANTFEDVLKLVDARADYIGVGPFRFTSTKENLSPVLGLEGYRNIMNQCIRAEIKIPIIAIGGITLNDVVPLMETGVYGIAVSSAINKTESIAESAEKFVIAVNDFSKVKNHVI